MFISFGVSLRNGLSKETALTSLSTVCRQSLPIWLFIRNEGCNCTINITVVIGMTFRTLSIHEQINHNVFVYISWTLQVCERWKKQLTLRSSYLPFRLISKHGNKCTNASEMERWWFRHIIFRPSIQNCIISTTRKDKSTYADSRHDY